MSEAPQIIETSRLILRSPSLEDAPSIFEQYAQDKQVTRYMTWRPHSNIETTRKFLQQCINATDFFWVIVPKKKRKSGRND